MKHTNGFYWVKFSEGENWTLAHFHNGMFHGFGVGSTRISKNPLCVNGVRILEPDESYDLSKKENKITDILFSIYRTAEMLSKYYTSSYCLKAVMQRVDLLQKAISEKARLEVKQ